MNHRLEDDVEELRRAWKAQYAREHDRLSRNIGDLESVARGDWPARAFYELRHHLQTIDALNERVFTLFATLRLTQKRLALVEAELARLHRNRQSVQP